MTDQELADRIVSLGVGNSYWMGPEAMLTQAFVRDWRVAGALMEKCKSDVIVVDTENSEPYVSIRPQLSAEVWAPLVDSMPRAICEACCEAIEGTKDA